MTSEEAADVDRSKAIRFELDPVIVLLRKTRQRAILDLAREDDPARVASIVDGLIDVSQSAARLEPDYFSVQQLQSRYGLQRKATERLPIPKVRIGGSVRFARADVLAYEARQREEN